MLHPTSAIMGASQISFHKLTLSFHHVLSCAEDHCWVTSFIHEWGKAFFCPHLGTYIPAKPIGILLLTPGLLLQTIFGALNSTDKMVLPFPSSNSEDIITVNQLLNQLFVHLSPILEPCLSPLFNPVGQHAEWSRVVSA